MIRKSILSLLFTGLILSAFAASVDQQTAQKVARNFYFEKAALYSEGVDFSELSFTNALTRQFRGTDCYYIFTFSAGGFVIIAADDVLPPVIGYSLDGTYEEDNQPDSYRNFMQTYSDAVIHIQKTQLKQSHDISSLWKKYTVDDPTVLTGEPESKSVAPLITSKWNQDYPYNAFCPADPSGPGGHVYAGCVATAMSQVMYYWRYPLQGTGSHSYYYPPYGNISANFGNTTYQWDAMQNGGSYEHPEAIAELQFHCGVAVDMMYGPGGSGAYSNDVPPALENYFGYSNDCYFASKDNYSTSVWSDKLKDNLDNSWPMYYSGFSSSGGHAFVCDGYQDNYFHFNFGWSGSSDGYYTLLTVGGFNDGQGAVFDTYPENNYPYYCTGDHIVTGMVGSFEDGSGPTEDYENNVDCSWLISPQLTGDTISHIRFMFVRLELGAGDKITIYDGPTSQSSILTELTGNTNPGVLNSTQNQILVTFSSDGSQTSPGWLLEYDAIIPDFCHGVVTFNTMTGNLSDGSGDYNYHNGSTCMWKIIPEQNEPVTIHFSSFDTESGVDRVRVYDLETQEFLAEYSGFYSQNNLPAPVTATSGKMFIAFSTNPSVTKQGWSAWWDCGPTGISNQDKNETEAIIFPNPASGKTWIKLPGTFTGQSTLGIYTSEGVLQRSMTCDIDPGNHTGIDLKGLQSGLYFIKLTSLHEQATLRLIVR